jgi:hypothetical protein
VGEPSDANDRSKRAAQAGGSTADEPKPWINWEDPNIPVGNAPPLPKWPLVLSGFAWLLWVVLVLVLSVAQHSGGAGMG